MSPSKQRRQRNTNVRLSWTSKARRTAHRLWTTPIFKSIMKIRRLRPLFAILMITAAVNLFTWCIRQDLTETFLSYRLSDSLRAVFGLQDKEEGGAKSSLWLEVKQLITLSNTKFYVHSALLERNKVTITGWKEREVPIKQLFCAYSYPTEPLHSHSLIKKSIVKASVWNLLEYPLEYSSACITCPLKRLPVNAQDSRVHLGDFKTHRLTSNGNSSLEKNPMETAKGDFLKLTLLEPVEKINMFQSLDKLCGEKGTRCKIWDLHHSHTETLTVFKNVEFTVCGPTLHNNYSDVPKLVEKIEMSRLLGAGRMVFYNYSMSAKVGAVLRMYARDWAEGRETLQVLVYPWELPDMFNRSNLHYFGQVTAINTCLNRFRWSSRYIVVTDLDEQIIPRTASNWSELIAQLKRRHPSHSNFQFLHTVFRSEWPSPAEGFKAAAEEYKSKVLGFTTRESFIFPSVDRSKMIVDPRAVDEIGIHHIRGRFHVVAPADGLLHHYTSTTAINSGPDISRLKKRNTPVIDRHAAETFGEQLSALLQRAWSRINNQVA